MTWLKVDDSIYDHPKFDNVSLRAVGLWMFAGAYCARHLTDGLIGLRAVVRLGGSEQIAQELISAGLWVIDGDGYRFHDWHDHQPSRDEIHERRKASAERVRKHREQRKSKPSAPLPDDDVTRYNGVTERVTNASCNATPDPTRPDPTRPPTKSVARKKQATPAPDIFPITDAMRKWAASKAPAVDIDDETEKLLDWARANGKTYTDWVATWRNWMRREPQFRPRTQPQPVQGTLALAQRLRAQEQQ